MSKPFLINDQTPRGILFPGVIHEFDKVSQSPPLQMGLRGPQGYSGIAAPFPADWLIPRSEWQARIAERKARKSSLRDQADRAEWPCKTQSLGYCWIFSVTNGVELIRIRQNEPLVSLSPASAGAQIKNFRDQGGWPGEGLAFVMDNGLVPSSIWPDNSLNRALLTEENKALAKNYRVLEAIELESKDLDQLVSCLLRNFPVPVGIQLWFHAICAVDVDWVDGEACPVIRNSWGRGWGDNGYGTLQGIWKYADDQVCIRTALASP
jgi:hypothetical protein